MTLHQLQVSRLIPLELELFRRSDHASITSGAVDGVGPGRRCNAAPADAAVGGEGPFRPCVPGFRPLHADRVESCIGALLPCFGTYGFSGVVVCLRR